MKARKRDLIGRTIVEMDRRRQWDPGRRCWYDDPVIILDNGARIYFSTVETEGSDYGIDIHIAKPTRRKA